MKKLLLRLLRDLLLKLIVIVVIGDWLFTVAGYLGHFHWSLDLFSHFRVQYLVVALACVAGFGCFRARWWVLIGLGCALLNAVVIVPWYLPRSLSEARPRAHNFRVLLCNVLWKNQNYAAVIDLVQAEKPDVFVLQEAEGQWLRAMRPLASEYPFQRNVLEHDGRIGCFSRHELQDAGAGVASGNPHQRIVTRLDLNGRSVSIITLHAPSPLSREESQERNRQLSEIALVARQLPPPTIVVGDFNASLWTPYFTEMVRDSGLVEARKGFGVLPTWPNFSATLNRPLGVNIFPLVKIPVDHCLVSPDIKVVNCRTGSDVGSDHLPLIVDLFIDANKR
ncbi:MAG TPA: endonuclease/exonuclease/phosphatase family protein [Blastocatellia bacterium]|nr:endonuclease/exonuclease/phosphatase family protein [Blastocatellia bacterium]